MYAKESEAQMSQLAVKKLGTGQLKISMARSIELTAQIGNLPLNPMAQKLM
jgi:hypothetical protein